MYFYACGQGNVKEWVKMTVTERPSLVAPNNAFFIFLTTTYFSRFYRTQVAQVQIRTLYTAGLH